MDGCGFVRISRLVDKMGQDMSPEEVLQIVRQDDKVGTTASPVRLCWYPAPCGLLSRAACIYLCVSAVEAARQGGASSAGIADPPADWLGCAAGGGRQHGTE